MKKMVYLWVSVLIFCLASPLKASHAVKVNGTYTRPSLPEIEERVQEWMQAGDIPGLILVIVGAEGEYGPVFIKGYGYADLDTRAAVTPETLFELASCSKAFTALAALRLEQEGLIRLDSHVSDYFPWFYVTHNKRKYKITLRQLLHHTSGIPWKTFSLIPRGSHKHALDQVVRNVSGVELSRIPGEGFLYNSINYDIVGAVIEKAAGKSFETYLENDVFPLLGLTAAFVGVEKKRPLMASGYKRGFFQQRKYDPPIFKGNNPAAYIVANGSDMARWLRLQLGQVESDFAPLVRKSHEPDLTVPPSRDLTSYAMGWNVSPYKNGETFHSGLNPNFTGYIGFRPKEKIGVAVLANCNSPFTQFIGRSVMTALAGGKISPRYPSTDRVDAFCSIFSFVLALYIFVVILLILVRISGIFRGKCAYEPLNRKKAARLAIALLGGIPFIYGIYLIPFAAAQMSWAAALVWAPASFKAAVFLLLSAIGISYIQFVLSLISPTKNKYRNEIPLIAVIGILSGLSGTAIIFIVTTSFFSTVGLGYLLYYFGLAYLLNVGGRKIAQTKMINISNNIVLDLRTDLINKLVDTPYEKFEKIQDGRIFTTLNDDTSALAGSADIVINASVSAVTLISGFIYMTTISLLSTLVIAAVTVAIMVYFRIVARKSRVFMEAARDSKNAYMSLLNSLVLGYKELCIHRRRRYEFKQDLIHSSQVNCTKTIIASVKFLNAQLIGSSIGLIVIGILSIVISRLVTGVHAAALISFVMVLLYLLEPYRMILNLVPALTRLRVSWDRIKHFVKDVDRKGRQESVKEFIEKIDLVEKQETIDLTVLDHLHENVENIRVEGLIFAYEEEDGNKGFAVGPVDFEVNKGEVLFITGGNGSGKTTMAKLVTGLYLHDKGSIKINNMEVDNSQIGEYFSTIYSNYHLFQKIYGIDLSKKQLEIQNYLKILNLEEKVQLKDGSFSTLNLSGGQRKRLALLQCYLEDCPIYLFDEVAADQDPEFRRFFYRDLLLRMKKRGKIVIAITHDDHYFDAADKIIKMDMGKIEADYLSIDSPLSQPV